MVSFIHSFIQQRLRCAHDRPSPQGTVTQRPGACAHEVCIWVGHPDRHTHEQAMWSVTHRRERMQQTLVEGEHLWVGTRLFKDVGTWLGFTLLACAAPASTSPAPALAAGIPI